jgi:hypothetical protein
MIREIRPSWIAFGWFLALAVTGLVLLALFAFGVIDAGPDANPVWIAAAILVGFVAGGFLTGMRTGSAPIVHGIGIGLFSIVAWVLVNLFAGEPTGSTTWNVMSLSSAVALLFLATAAAVVGTRAGVRASRIPVSPDEPPIESDRRRY